MKTAFDDFYLFDDFSYFMNYKSKFLEHIKDKYASNEKFVKACEVNLSYLESFYKNRYVLEKIDNINIETFKEKLVHESNLLFDSLGTMVISSHKLYGVMRLKHRDEMLKLGELNNPSVFFQVCELLLSRKYVFEKPFISKSKTLSLTNDELMMRYAYSQQKITVASLTKYADKMHFKKIDSILKFFVAISEQYVQVSIDTLIDKDLLNISDDLVEKIRKEIVYYINSFGPIETSKYVGYSVLPSIELKWNKYLLIGIVRTFLNDELKIEYTEKAYNKTDFIITLR